MEFQSARTPLLPPAIAIPAHLGTVSLLAVSPNGKLVASSGSDRSVKVWDAATGVHLHEFGGYTDYLADIQLPTIVICLPAVTTVRSVNGIWRLVQNRSCPSLTLWQRSTGVTQTHPIAGNRLRLLRYSADGQRLAGITDDGTLNLWDLTQNYYHRAWQISPQEVRSIAFDPDRVDRLIVGGDTGEIAVWDLHHQQCLARNAAHQLPVTAVGILPDRRLISCGIDAAIRLWELQDGELVQVQAIEFSKPYQGMNLTDVKGLNRSQLQRSHNWS
ncbi:MAG: hypothetical protein HC778_06100, partial [Chamaesiphon sp. CSU_1_12]|nr:hypothetical protein [Chamaesiphon sp. CSU_1_12]